MGMVMPNIRLFLLISSLLALASCSVEKRIYRPGLHVVSLIDQTDGYDSRTASQAENGPEMALARHNELSDIMLSSIRPHLPANDVPNGPMQIEGPGCDTLIMKDGSVRLIEFIRYEGGKLSYKICGTDSLREVAAGETSRVAFVEMGVTERAQAEVSASEFDDNPEFALTAVPAMSLSMGAFVAAIALVIMAAVLSFAPWVVVLLGAILFFSSLAGIVLSGATIRILKRKRGQYRGKPLAVLGFIFGIIASAILMFVTFYFLQRL
jgi:hypothetical protein